MPLKATSLWFLYFPLYHLSFCLSFWMLSCLSAFCLSIFFFSICHSFISAGLSFVCFCLSFFSLYYFFLSVVCISVFSSFLSVYVVLLFYFCHSILSVCCSYQSVFHSFPLCSFFILSFFYLLFFSSLVYLISPYCLFLFLLFCLSSTLSMSSFFLIFLSSLSLSSGCGVFVKLAEGCLCNTAACFCWHIYVKEDWHEALDRESDVWGLFHNDACFFQRSVTAGDSDVTCVIRGQRESWLWRTWPAAGKKIEAELSWTAPTHTLGSLPVCLTVSHTRSCCRRLFPDVLPPYSFTLTD